MNFHIWALQKFVLLLFSSCIEAKLGERIIQFILILIRVSYFVTVVSSIKYHLEFQIKQKKILISATSNLAYQE